MPLTEKQQAALLAGRRISHKRKPAPVAPVDAPPSLADLLEAADGDGAADGADVTIGSPPPPPAPPDRNLGERIADRIRGALTGDVDADPDAAPAPARKRSRITVARSNEFVAQLVPVAALLLAVVTDALLASEYKACAPSQDEATALVTPLCRILGRQLKTAGKLSENSVDLIMFIAAIGVYGIRVRDTLAEIGRQHGTGARGGAAGGAGGAGGTQGGRQPTDQDAHGAAHGPGARANGQVDGAAAAWLPGFIVPDTDGLL